MCKLWSVLFHPSYDDGGDDKDEGRQECPGDGHLLDCLRRERRVEGRERGREQEIGRERGENQQVRGKNTRWSSNVMLNVHR